MSAARSVFAHARAILVDLDGTLIDSQAPARRAWSAFADRHGLDPLMVEDFVRGRPSRESVRLLAPRADPVTEARRLEHDEVSDSRDITALPGAAEVLASPRPLAIVTSCSRQLALVRLTAARLSVPTHLVTSDDVAAGKPDPACYRLAAERLGVPPADCVVIEDAPAGIASGRAAGAQVIAVRSGFADVELTEADCIVDGLTALLAPSATGAARRFGPEAER